jgi:Tol biopolymer transport system component/predicted Ser/Thr protein kinase
MTEQPTKGSGRIAIGTRLGPYEILAPLGAGGMGEVYRARDTRLERSVAIKVLPAELARNPEFRQRFEREAKVISSLNHPHICSLFDIGQQEGVDYLVMEHLEGETLAERLRRGPLPTAEALRVGIAIADALERAHRQGVVHRDLKPGNVMLSKSGVKLMDFGLAKVRTCAPGHVVAGGGPQQSGLPTARQDLTERGTVLGTFQYMAPEQLEGNEADARTDIFALGTVIYEMATGRKAFGGKSQASLIAAILSGDPPPMTALQPLTPPALERLVRGCLAKDPDERWQSAGDVRRELRWIAEGSGAVAAAAGGPGVRRRPGRERLAWLAVGVALGLAAAAPFIFSYLREPHPGRRPVRLAVTPPASVTTWGDLAMSPDGRQIAFVAGSGERRTLWTRGLESLEARELPGTEGAAMPFWSPDGRFVGFFAAGKLKRITVAGGDPQTLADAAEGRGGTWNQDGIILFAPAPNSPLYRVSATGGTAVPVTKLDAARKEFSHRYPTFLPDGRHYLFYSPAGGWIKSDIYIGSLGSPERRWLMSAPSRVIYASPGYLLFVREGSLFAQPFDLERTALTGEPIAAGSRVSDRNSAGAYQYRLFSSGGGSLAYVQAPVAISRPVWLDRAGRLLSSLAVPGEHGYLSLSPDGSRLALTIAPPGGEEDVWLCDLSRGSFTRLTSHPSVDSFPVWSPDGAEIAFSTNRDGPYNLYRRRTAGVAVEEPLLASELNKMPLDWSRDGRFLVYRQQQPETGDDLWLLPMTGERKPIPYLRTPFIETEARISPDGHWLAWTSNESGRDEVYVGSFPELRRTWRISSEGGRYPAWRGDGKELFYVADFETMMAVPVEAGSEFRAGLPRPLFRAKISSYWTQRGVVAPDGQRFLVNEEIPGASTPPITVVLDWTADLRR